MIMLALHEGYKLRLQLSDDSCDDTLVISLGNQHLARSYRLSANDMRGARIDLFNRTLDYLVRDTVPSHVWAGKPGSVEHTQDLDIDSILQVLRMGWIVSIYLDILASLHIKHTQSWTFEGALYEGDDTVHEAIWSARTPKVEGMSTLYEAINKGFKAEPHPDYETCLLLGCEFTRVSSGSRRCSVCGTIVTDRIMSVVDGKQKLINVIAYNGFPRNRLLNVSLM